MNENHIEFSMRMGRGPMQKKTHRIQNGKSLDLFAIGESKHKNALNQFSRYI